jgi:ATP-dependent Lhr-like helicase
VEEYFASLQRKGDTFLIGGEIVRYEGMREMVVEVTRTPGRSPRSPTFMGTKFATSTQLSDRILTMFRQDDWPPARPHPPIGWPAAARPVETTRTRPAACRKLPP